MNITTLKAALFTWAHRVLNPEYDEDPPVIGTVVYWGEPNGPRPANPSLRLKLVAGPTQVGLDELRDVDGSDTAFKVVGPRSYVLSVTAYGDDSQQAISDLITSGSKPDDVATLGVAGVALLSFGAPRDLSTMLDTKYEQRTQVDVTVGAMVDTEIEPGVIEHVVGTSTIEGTNGDITGDLEAGDPFEE